MTKRISWDEYFIEVTKLISRRSTCPRFRTGAIIVKDNKIIASGYNGAPKKLPHCDDIGCLIVNGHCIRTIHAEQNALLQAGQRAEGGTMYCIAIPCPICFKMIIQSGIKRIVYIDAYKKDDSNYWIENGGVEIEQWKS